MNIEFWIKVTVSILSPSINSPETNKPSKVAAPYHAFQNNKIRCIFYCTFQLIQYVHSNTIWLYRNLRTKELIEIGTSFLKRNGCADGTVKCRNKQSTETINICDTGIVFET